MVKGYYKCNNKMAALLLI